MQAPKRTWMLAMDEPRVFSGRAKGGAVVASKMTPEQLSERAKKGALARWGKGHLKATHRGNFEVHFGIDAECYVLDDMAKTAVMTQRGIAAALGLSKPGGKDFERLVERKSISEHLGAEVLEKVRQPIEFKWVYPGAKQSAVSIKGYAADLLIDVCNAILKASAAGALRHNQESLAKQAAIVVGASAKAGIQGLVYALAGYDRTKEEVIAAYKMYVAEEAREYEREFSPELYEQWYRLYGLVKPERGRPWEFRYLTIDHIYKPLARSNGKVFNLAKSAKLANGEKTDKIHQFLSEIGVKALRTQVGKITGIATVSDTREEYERYISEKIYGQATLPFNGG
jgi:P63C domain